GPGARPSALRACSSATTAPPVISTLSLHDALPILLLAASMLRADSVPLPVDSVTPLAVHDDPGPTVASTQVVPPSALTWIFSPAPSAPLNCPLAACHAPLAMTS